MTLYPKPATESTVGDHEVHAHMLRLGHLMRLIPGDWNVLRDPAGKLYSAAFVQLQPDVAKAVLENHNEGNRPLSISALRHLKVSILRGEWMLTGQPIIFDINGLLLDGQHRLTSCVANDFPLSTLAVVGIDREAFRVLDSGKKRGLSDHLSILGEQQAVRLAATVRSFHLFLSTGIISENGVRKHISVRQAEEILAIHPGLRNSVDTVGSWNPRTRLIPVGGFASAMHYVLSQADPEHGERFMRSMVLNQFPIGDCWGALQYVNGLILDKKSRGLQFNRSTLFNLTAKAWEWFRKGRAPKSLKMPLPNEVIRIQGIKYDSDGLPILASTAVDYDTQSDMENFDEIEEDDIY